MNSNETLTVTDIALYELRSNHLRFCHQMFQEGQHLFFM